MPSGLVALLDDIALIARAAAASVDDIGAAATRASAKAAGVVIDDTAVTPAYVGGLDPARELPIIARIAWGSLRNKLLILLPAALLLSALLPGAIVFLLLLGGGYLAFEGAEKVMEKLGAGAHGHSLADPVADPQAFERMRVAGAIRTDLVLSAEIMAITLGEVATEDLATRAGVLAVVGIGITGLVYGVVAVLVKLDDVGLRLARRREAPRAVRRFGLRLVHAMPRLLEALSLIGTAAMLWVGGGIVLHALHELGLHGPYALAHGAQLGVVALAGVAGPVLGWLANAALSALFGLMLGGLIALGVKGWRRARA